MKRLNIKFFDEFKKLDNLCIDRFGEIDGKRGVTLYIDQMDKNARLGKSSIDGWESDYKNLKDVRHTRNQLAHSQNSFSDKMCTKEQLEFVRSFKKNVKRGKDPLSLLKKNIKRKKARRRFKIFLISSLIILVAVLALIFLIIK